MLLLFELVEPLATTSGSEWAGRQNLQAARGPTCSTPVTCTSLRLMLKAAAVSELQGEFPQQGAHQQASIT